MNDQPDPNLPPDATRPILPPDPALGQGGPPAAPPKQRFSERMWNLRAVIAVALASVIIGGLAGAAIANVGDDNDDRGPGRFQRGGPMAPPGFQGQQRDGQRDGQRGFTDPRGQGQQQWGNGGPGAPNRVPTTPPTPVQPTPTG